MFHGIATLGDTIVLDVLVKNSSNVPINLDAQPTFRVYDSNGLVTNQTGSGSFRDTGSITGATNASPIVITSTAHGLVTGDRVTITGVGGNTNANTTTTITKVDADSFSLDGVAGNASYTSGGTWNVTGLYKVSLDMTEANGYDAGVLYSVLIEGEISSTAWASLEKIFIA